MPGIRKGNNAIGRNRPGGGANLTKNTYLPLYLYTGPHSQLFAKLARLFWISKTYVYICFRSAETKLEIMKHMQKHDAAALADRSVHMLLSLISLFDRSASFFFTKF